MSLFTMTLQDQSSAVKVASLKAITAFLSSIADEEIILKYSGTMGAILDVVIQVLQHDETQGKASLESLIELSAAHGEIWEAVLDRLIYVLSEIMKTTTFEVETRQSALEIISTICEETPSMFRKKQSGLKEQLFPAIF